MMIRCLRLSLPFLLLLHACQPSEDGRVISESKIIQDARKHDGSLLFYATSMAGSLNTLSYENGKLLQEGSSLLNTPCNLGFIAIAESNALRQIPAMLIGEPVSVNSLNTVELIAMCTFMESGQVNTRLLCKPVGDAISFDSFLTTHDPLKSAIQHWIRFRNGIGTVEQLKWHDTEAAFDFLQRG